MITTKVQKVAALIIAIGLFASIIAKDPEHGWLSTHKNYILNEKGNIVQLRGMSFYWSTSGWIGEGYYNSGTLDFLVDSWKCTVVRLAYDRNNGNDDGWGRVQTVLDAAINKGIYVILDWHSHTAHQQASTAVSWFRQKAEEYKNTPNVIFEPYNEPITTQGDAKDGSVENARKTWDVIKPYHTDVTQAIRSTGSKNLIILGTPYYCQHVGVAASDPVVQSNGQPFENVTYAFHFYAASHGPDAIYVERDNTGGMEATYLEAGYNSIPVFASEWGTTHSDGTQEVDESNTYWWFDRYIDPKHISWCNWSVSSGEGSSCFSGGTNPSQSGNIVKKLLNESVDEWEPEWVTGLEGPAGDTVWDMPADFHQASAFNNYYGTHVESTTVKYSYRDKIDRRIPGTLGYTVLRVTPADGDNWVSYEINSSSATKYILFRYHSKDGKGTMNILLDGNDAGEVTFQNNDTWAYAVVPVDISNGKHTLTLDFTNTEGEYFIEWFELTNDSEAPETTVTAGVRRGRSTIPIKIAPVKSGFTLSLPPEHGYTRYAVLEAQGRSVRGSPLSNHTRTIRINGLSHGMYLVKLEGTGSAKLIKTMVRGN
jgi:endoglucanase